MKNSFSKVVSRFVCLLNSLAQKPGFLVCPSIVSTASLICSSCCFDSGMRSVLVFGGGVVADVEMDWGVGVGVDVGKVGVGVFVGVGVVGCLGVVGVVSRGA